MQNVTPIENRSSSADQNLMADSHQKSLSHDIIEANGVAHSVQTSVTQKQLNPFALPAETDSRFNLFAIAAVMWVLNWTVMIWGVAGSGYWRQCINADRRSQ